MTEKSQQSARASPPSIPATIRALINSARGWLENLLHLAALEGKRAGIGLAVMVGFGVGAFVLLIAGWLALLACAVAALVENDILSWAWSLLIVALLNFARRRPRISRNQAQQGSPVLRNAAPAWLEAHLRTEP